MAVPALIQYQNGVGQISSDGLNTFVQTAPNCASLRTLIGLTNMAIQLQGFTTANDGGQGQFYWNPTSTATDDNGVTTVVPNGATVGVWTRLGTGNSSTIVNSITNSDGSLTISPTSGTVVASLGSYAANTALANATNASAQPTGVALTASTVLGRAATGNIAAIPYSAIFSTVAQGGFINKLRNPNFQVAQRGTSGTITAGTPSYSLDGWVISATGANVTWTQEGNQGNFIPGGLLITGATSNTDVSVYQRIEGHIVADMFPYGAVQNLTMQFTIYNNTGATLTPKLTTKYAGSLDNWGSSTTDLNAISLQSITNGGSATVAYTWTPSSGNYTYGLEVLLDFGAMASGSGTVQITSADLRATPVAATGLNNNPPFPELRPIGVELAFCQRYLFAYNSTTASSVAMPGFARGTGTTTFEIVFPLPVSLRTAATGITISAAGNFIIPSIAALSSLNFADSVPTSVHLTGTIVGGLTASSVYVWDSASSSASILFTGAEL